MSLRIRCLLVLSTLSAFMVLTGIAAAVYPGGNYYDRSHVGHHFWFNFLCDLLHRRGLGGGDNLVGSRVATAGMLLLVMGMAMYWTLAPRLMPSHFALGRMCMATGLLSSLGLVAVALSPSDHLPRLHTASIVMATAPGLLAGLCVVMGHVLETTTPWAIRLLAVAALLTVAATTGLFAIHTFFAGGYLRALPAMQRVAALLTLLWLATTTIRLLITQPKLGNSLTAATSHSLRA